MAKIIIIAISLIVLPITGLIAWAHSDDFFWAQKSIWVQLKS